MYRNTKLIFPLLLAAAVLPEARADVRLMQAWDLLNEGLKQPTALFIASEQDISVVDGDKGLWWHWQDGSAHKQVLGGKGAVLDSEELNGIARQGEGQWLVLSADDDLAAGFDAGLQRTLRIGGSGSDYGRLKSPQALAFSANERVYFADKGNDRVSVFARDGSFLYALGDDFADDKQRLASPKQVAVDAREQVYVLDRDGRLSVIADDGRLLRQIDNKEWRLPGGKPAKIVAMTADRNGLVYLADAANGKVVLFDWRNRAVLDSFGSSGKGRGQFADVVALHATAEGVLGVLDAGNHKLETYQLNAAKEPMPAARMTRVAALPVQKNLCTYARFNADGEQFCLDAKTKKVLRVDAQGQTRDFVTGLNKPRRLNWSGERLLLLDDNNLRVFDRQGKALTQFGRSGAEDGSFRQPEAAIWAFNRLWIADTGNDRIQMFTPEGVFLGKTGSDKQAGPVVRAPAAIAADSKGSLFVADGKTQRIKVFNRALELQYELGNENGALEDIIDLQVDADDQLYALVRYGHGGMGLRVYNGRSLSLRLGNESDTGNGLLRPLSLSVTSGGKSAVLIHDEKRQAVIGYALKAVPGRIGGVKIAGADRGTQLRWQAGLEHFVDRYRVYGWTTAQPQPRLLAEVADTQVLLDNAHNNVEFFAVSAVSGWDIESELSQAWRDTYAEGRRAFDAGQLATAEQAFATTVSDYPDNADAIRMWGRTLAQLNRVDEALSRFDQLAQMPEQSGNAMQYKLETLVAAKRYLDARALLDGMLATRPDNAQPYWWCAEINTALHDPVGAIGCLEEVLKRAPKRLEAKLLLGKTYIAAGAVDMGMRQLEEAQALAPQDKRIKLARAQQMMAVGKAADALNLFQDVLAAEPDTAEARLGVAQAQHALGALDLAKSAAISLASHPQLGTSASLLLGQIALTQNQPQEAMLSFSRVLRGEQKPAAAWLGMADVYVAMNQADKELEACRSAVSSEDAGVEAWRRLGRLEATAKNLEQAMNALGRALQLAPRDAAVLSELARAELQAGHLNEAREHVQQVLAQNQNDAALWLLQASIGGRQGKLTDAIESLKRAEKLQPDSPEVKLQLATLYFDTGQYEAMTPILEKLTALRKDWAPVYALRAKWLGSTRQYDKAIAAAEKAVALEPNEDNKSVLNSLLADRKRGSEVQQSAASVALENLKLKPVFSAAYKVYGKQSIGSVMLRNTGNSEQKGLRVRFELKGYMDFPYTYDVNSLAPKAAVEIPLYATFNNRVLEVDEDTGVQIEVAVSYQQNSTQTLQSFTRPTTLYGKNAIQWSNSDMVGAFVTPRDDVLRDFVRQSVNASLPQNPTLNKNMLLAMTYFSTLTAQGLRYQPDPNSPYSKLAADQIDYVQFPRETLRLRSGDCDDLSVLLSAGLENLGVETALVEVPGHLFLIFNSGVSTQQRDSISLDQDLVLDIDGQAWVPLESTLLATTFSESWAEGARKFKQNRDRSVLSLVPLRDAWQKIPPVTLPSGEAAAMPAVERVAALVKREHELLLGKSLERLVEPYRALTALGGDTRQAQLQIAIQYAKAGLYDKALTQLDELLVQLPQYAAAHVAMGNVYYLRKDYRRALDAYALAERLEPDDAGIKVDVALSYYGAQQMPEASMKYREAVTLDPALGKRYETFAKLLSN